MTAVVDQKFIAETPARAVAMWLFAVAALVAMMIALLLIGLAVARGAGLSWAETKTISVETGIQNSALGITLAGLIAGVTDGFSPFALPSGVYGITMYVVALPFIAWVRNKD